MPSVGPGQHGGRRRHQTGRPRKVARDVRICTLFGAAELASAYRALTPQEQTQVRAAALAALILAIEETQRSREE